MKLVATAPTCTGTTAGTFARRAFGGWAPMPAMASYVSLIHLADHKAPSRHWTRIV